MAVVEQKLHDRRNSGLHIRYAKTMSSSRGAKLGSLSNHDDNGNTNPHKFAYLTMKNSIFARFARAFFIFWHFEDVLEGEKSL